MLMVFAMDGNPSRRSVLKTTNTEYGESVLQPSGTRKRAMCEQAVIAEVDPECAKNVSPEQTQSQAGPAE
jgi:hypothetical protein